MTDAFLALERARDTFAGYSAAEIEDMSMAEFSRLRERAGLTPVIPVTVYGDGAPEPPGGPHGPPQPLESQPQGVDIGEMDMDEYAALRGQLGMGVSRKEGRGIFDSVSSRSQAYTDASRAHVGRTAWSNANVAEPPRITGRYVRQDDLRDTRSAAERFSTPGNSFSL